jgi:hypothetical protein
MLDNTRPEVTGADLNTAIWDDESGETWQAALNRFESIGHGPLLSAAEVATILGDEGEVEFYSFGYGDVPASEVYESIVMDGAEAVDIYWGPFIRVRPA